MRLKRGPPGSESGYQLAPKESRARVLRGLMGEKKMFPWEFLLPAACTDSVAVRVIFRRRGREHSESFDHGELQASGSIPRAGKG